jgi:thioredoxin reductase (NADPH)
VTVIHRRDSFRAEKILQERLFKHPNIKVIWNKQVARFVEGEGAAGLVAIELEDTQDGTISQVAVEGGFVAIGHSPATELFKGSGLTLDKEGYIVVRPGTSLTNISGVFACGDVADKVYRQAVTAAGTGCMAALDAERFLQAADFPVPEDAIAGHPIDPAIEHAAE